MATFRDNGRLRRKGSTIYFVGKSTPKGRVKEHQIHVRLLDGLGPGDQDGLPVRVTFNSNGSAERVERLDEDGKVIRPASPAPVVADAAPAPAVPHAQAVPPTPATRPPSAAAATRTPLANARSFPIPGIDDSFVPAYNFIPLADRGTLPEELRDAEPATHGRDLPDRYSGTISVTITTKTPLLLPDHSAATPARVKDGDHDFDVAALPTRATNGKKPILEGSAIKGMLRSAYEAITASRLGVFGEHKIPLAVRAPARAGSCPAVVTKVDDNTRELTVLKHLLPRALHGVFPDGRNRPARDVNQVWIPKDRNPDLAPNLEPGAPLAPLEIDAWIQLAWHERGRFYFWQVVNAVRSGRQLPAEPPPSSLVPSPRHTFQGYSIAVRGFVHWTDSRFPMTGRQTKHDERLVVTEVLKNGAGIDATILTCVLDEQGLAEWRSVIDSFRGVRGRGDNVDNLGDYARPLGPGAKDRWRDLDVGRTLHVTLANRAGREIATRPRPGLIGRDPFKHSPREVMSTEKSGGGHLAAISDAKLSPAERVFGWTMPDRKETETADGKGVPGHRGHLRVNGAIGDVNVHSFGDSIVALATMNSPKPTQYRFYLRDSSGSTIGANGRTNGQGDRSDFGAEKGYRADDRIAGRKVYLYDARTVGSTEYWTPTPLARVQGGFKNECSGGQPAQVTAQHAQRHREYLAPSRFKPKTATYIKSWVPMGCTFSTTVTVDNLTETELGALLWLLSLPSSVDGTPRAGHLRLGLGKPLGFGVVRVDYDPERTRISTGSAVADTYRTLGSEPATVAPAELTGLRDRYDQLLLRNADLNVVRTAFLTAAWGEWNHPVHSPRPDPVPHTESFEWWTRNERRNDDSWGTRLGLPLLESDDRRLPYNSTILHPAP